ncbi:MAG: hypothetical protein JNK82_36115 [Myxococcaceae bacterium]|nr:hypothetical protein [Myxococcaceae bacterium]
MDRAELLAIYEKLWRTTESAGAFVVYRGEEADEAGWFHPRFDEETGEPNPEVVVVRLPAPEPNSQPTFERAGVSMSALELETELHVLAHEAGHFRSFLTRGEAWRTYHAAAVARDEVIAGVDLEPAGDFAVRTRAAISAQLAEAQRLLIVGEEQLAWNFGRELLRDAGLQDFSRYDESARRGVHFHRYRLGLDELWPGDEL